MTRATAPLHRALKSHSALRHDKEELDGYFLKGGFLTASWKVLILEQAARKLFLQKSSVMG